MFASVCQSKPPGAVCLVFEVGYHHPGTPGNLS